MFQDRFDLGYPQALLIGLTGVMVITLAVAASTSAVAFGIYNPTWDGTSELRSVAGSNQTDLTIFQDTVRYERLPSERTTAILLAPETSYTGDAANRLRSFVRAGGTLVIADDFGTTTNPLLQRLGVQSRISRGLLRDERYYYRSPTIPIANNVTAHPLTDGVRQLTLNHGSSIQPDGANTTVLVRTSAFAYVDRNRNDRLDITEELGRRPVVVVESLGQGRVVVVGDPSLFINAMVDQPDNRAFIRSLSANADHVVLDYSHTARFPPLSYAILILRQTPLLQFLGGLAAIGLFTILWRLPVSTYVRNRVDTTLSTSEPGLTREEITSIIKQRHPEWEDDRIERVADSVVTSSSSPTDSDN